MEYSPWTLNIETNGVLEACRELGVTVVAYSPLGRGFLTVIYPFFNKNKNKKNNVVYM
jgi:aryl-alcohol dehydrogenase-like predicted oxidoreductase